jgi:hypothetical protein
MCSFYYDQAYKSLSLKIGTILNPYYLENFMQPALKNQWGFAPISFLLPEARPAPARLPALVAWNEWMTSHFSLHNSFTGVFAFRGHFNVNLSCPHVTSACSMQFAKDKKTFCPRHYPTFLTPSSLICIERLMRFTSHTQIRFSVWFPS